MSTSFPFPERSIQHSEYLFVTLTIVLIKNDHTIYSHLSHHWQHNVDTTNSFVLTLERSRIKRPPRSDSEYFFCSIVNFPIRIPFTLFSCFIYFSCHENDNARSSQISAHLDSKANYCHNSSEYFIFSCSIVNLHRSMDRLWLKTLCSAHSSFSVVHKMTNTTISNFNRIWIQIDSEYFIFTSWLSIPPFEWCHNLLTSNCCESDFNSIDAFKIIVLTPQNKSVLL